jgi:integrase
MRQGEVLGLARNNVDFVRNTIYVRQQLQRERDGSGKYHLASPKNGKGRVLTAEPYVMAVLQEQQKWQAKQKAALGDAWEENNLVFTNEIGHYLSAQIVYREFKRIVTSIGCKETRFHDLRHSYAVAAIQSGDDIKTVQENLGHYCAAFALDTYAHVSASMKMASAQRIENFIKSVT